MTITNYNQADDQQLAEAAPKDHDAFETLYRRHVTAIYRYCYARVENVAEAEDLTSQTFMAALESLRRYGGRGTFLAWLFSIARNKCHDYYRAAYARPAGGEPAAVDAADADEQLADESAADPEAQLLLNDVWHCIERMFPHLSADRVEALRLRYWGGLSMAEIARVMRRTEAAAKMLVSRAISDLRERCVTQ